jgi:hypothetical protein
MSSTQPDRETAVLSGNLLRTGGQNPTVKFVWGDEDGEISGMSWDNTVVISTNQAAGSFSTTITIPNQEKIYYFRSVAENAGGTVVSRSLGVLNPSAPVGVADLRGRWSFDDSNFSVPDIVSPTKISGLQLWLDAADTSTISHSSNSVTQWDDKSGNGYHATAASGQEPTTGSSTINDKNVLTWSLGKKMKRTTPSGANWQDVYIVGQWTGGATFDNVPGIFGGTTSANSDNGIAGGNNSGAGLWFAAWTDHFYLNGTSNPGSNVVTEMSSPFIISFSQNNAVSMVGYQVGADRTNGGREWKGEFGEVLAFNTKLSDLDRKKVQTYLSQKWNISIPSESTSFVSSAKDSSANNYNGILRKKFQLNNLSDIKLWLDASDTSTITHSSNAVSHWNDKSGNNFHHTPGLGSPTTNTQLVHGKNVIAFDGNDGLSLTNASLGNLINGTNNDMAVFVVFLNSLDSGHKPFRLSQASGNNSSFELGTQYNENQMRTIFYNSSGENDGVDGNIELINQTLMLQGGYDGSLVKQFVNGTEFTGGLGNNGIGTISGANVSKIGEGLNGHIAEIIALDNWTTSATRQKIEGYLAHKWGLTSNLPSGHPYKHGHPLSTGSPSFITDTPFGDGKAIDLADGHVEISTGGNEDVFDGNGYFSVSAWVKGWPDEEKESIISKGYAIPKLESNPNMKLWLDAADPSTLGSSVKLNEVTISGPSSSSQRLGEVFDGNWNNSWRIYKNNLPNNAFVKWTFNNSNSFRVTKYRLSQVTNKSHPKAFILYGSNDNTTWTEVDNRSSVTWSTTQTEIKSYTVQNPGYYSYYRFNITERGNTSANSWVEIREIDLIGSYTTVQSSKAVSLWNDKSGNDNHATQTTPSRMPTYSISDSLLNNKSSVSSSSQNGSIGLDLPSTSLQEIFVVAYYKDGSDDSFDNYNTLISGPGSSGQYRIMGEINSANWFSSSTSTLNNGGTFKNGVTSSTTTALPMPATLLRFTSSVARTETRGILYNTQVADRGWIGGVGEIIGLSTISSSSDRQKVEAYLARKWGLTDQLSAGHPGKLSGWSVGRNISESNDLSVNIGGIGGTKTATHSTALSTDNQWHHIVSTYDGGSRKIYLDGTEVSSASASGSVASTTATLLLGASDMNNTAGTVAAARHSGIKLDEVRFYTSGLTSSQVSALYNFGKGDIGNIGDFATLPSKISGIKGTALSTTVTAAFPNAYYEAVNLTPGLGINSATGEISGTPTVGGVGSITVIAKNAAGKRAVTTIPYDSSPSGPAFSFPTLSPGSDHAVILGEISHSGGEENTVDLFWGDNDGNQTLSNWDSNATPLGTGKEGFYGTTISGLTAGETYYYRIRSQGKINPKGISGSNLQLWFDASDSSTISHSSNAVSTWKDKSGNGYHATTPTGSPTLNPTGGPVGKPVVEFRSGTSNGTTGDDELSISGTFTVKDHFYVVRSPSATWSDYGGIIGGGGSRHSNFIFERSENYFHSNVYPSAVWKNGSSITSSNFNLSVINQYMILRIVVNDNNLGPHSNWKLGDDGTGWSMDMDLAEAVCFSSQLSPSDAQKIEGYLAHKWGLEANLPGSHSYLTNYPVSQTSWSTVQSFTTPTNVTVPVLGPLGTANLTTTTADLEATLSDNGNAATSLVFYWGDNDGGNNPSSWDSNFTVSNAQEGTLRKSLTGLTSGNTYYFRTFASNWKGNVWANTTRSFTTVTSTVRDNPVRNSDLKGWWKLDGNLLDSSGNNYHGDGTFIWKPSVLNTLKVWFDASDSSTISHSSNAVSTWKDKSGNGYHATTPTGSPTLNPTGGPVGKPVVEFRSGTSNGTTGDDELSISGTFTVKDHFYVVRSPSATWSDYGGIIGGGGSRESSFIFERDNIHFHSNTYPSAVWKNGSSITSSNFNLSVINQYMILRIVVNDNNLGPHSNWKLGDDGTGWSMDMDLAEAVCFSSQLSPSDAQKVEGYLAHKWGLSGNLAKIHPYKSVLALVGSSPFSTDVASGSGQSLDLSAGTFATVSTGGTEDVFDGDNNFSISMWIKGWPADVNQSILSKNLIPTPKGISAKLWLDASDTGSFVLAERNADTTDASISSTNVVYNSRGVSGAFDKGTHSASNWKPAGSQIPDVNAKWTFLNPFKVTKYKIQVDNSANKQGQREPKSFLLYGSNDGTNWTVVDDKDSSTTDHQTGWAALEERTFPVSTPANYRYYKLKITRATKNNTFALYIRELSLIGKYPAPGPIQEWQDKSGNDNHARQTTAADQPTITTSGMSGKAGLDFDNDKLSIPEIDMAGKTLFAVIQPDSSQDQQVLSHSSTNVQLRLSGSNQLQYAAASPLYTNETASTGTLANNQISIISFTLDNTLGFSINGTFQDSGVSKGSTGSSIFNQIGTHGASGERFNGKMGEIIIIDSVSPTDRQKVEAYLAHKWGLTSQLPAGHPGTSGWSLERSTSGPDDLTLNLLGAGGKFTQAVPMNDDSWHHLVTTFGGGTKKIFVDGQEVASASQSGSVTDSISKLFLGDPYASGSNQPKIDDVRFYRGILSAADISAIYNNRAGDVGAPKFAISSPSTIQGSEGKIHSLMTSLPMKHMV